MDQFSAHLDRGWDLVQRGDTRGAEASARRALEIDPHSPEALQPARLRRGARGRRRGGHRGLPPGDRARRHLPRGDAQRGRGLHPPARRLRRGDRDVRPGARSRRDRRGDHRRAAAQVRRPARQGRRRRRPPRSSRASPKGPYDNPNHAFLVGRAYYEIGEVERPRRSSRRPPRKTRATPRRTTTSGLVRDERGDAKGATEAFLRSRELDLELGAPRGRCRASSSRKLAEKAVLGLDPVLERYVRDADVYVSDVPGMELVADGVDPARAGAARRPRHPREPARRVRRASSCTSATSSGSRPGAPSSSSTRSPRRSSARSRATFLEGDSRARQEQASCSFAPAPSGLLARGGGSARFRTSATRRC